MKNVFLLSKRSTNKTARTTPGQQEEDAEENIILGSSSNSEEMKSCQNVKQQREEIDVSHSDAAMSTWTCNNSPCNENTDDADERSCVSASISSSLNMSSLSGTLSRGSSMSSLSMNDFSAITCAATIGPAHNPINVSVVHTKAGIPMIQVIDEDHSVIGSEFWRRSTNRRIQPTRDTAKTKQSDKTPFYSVPTWLKEGAPI